MLIVGLGAFGSAHLSDVNHASEVIRNHWLRDTGILGDISNYMSDYRAAEANRLLASTAAEEAASDKEIAALARAPSLRSQRAYEKIAQDPAESGALRGIRAAVGRLSADCGPRLRARARGREPAGDQLYKTESRRAFDLSSDTLSRLTDQTLVKARRDSDRAASTYAHARTMLVTAILLAAFLLLGVIVYVVARHPGAAA